MQELNNDSHKNDIKFGIKQLTRLRPQSILNSVNEIVIRLDRFSNPPQARDKIIYINEIPPSFERSKGKFINKFKDKTNYKIFEYIRKLILAKQ
ncbi:MAG: hypothetical protein MR902_03185 [Campylobacter sp.]|nr:hypothetical protein [Campylobacter sp.]